MKRTHLLNRHISALIASLGHLDEITIADAGLPAPTGVNVIDLAVTKNVPDFWSVLDSVRSELVIEGYIIAEESPEFVESKLEIEMDIWQQEQNRDLAKQKKLTHSDFKLRTTQSKAIIRTGTVTPFCNIILISGVAF